MLTEPHSPNFATVIGPVLGGALAQSPGWRWIFWVLTFSSGFCLLLIAFFLPETSRFIVGNGSRKFSSLHRTLFSYFRAPKISHVQSDFAGSEKGPSELSDDPIRNPFRTPNPLRSLKMLWTKDTALITLICGVYYMNFSCLQASMSTLFIKIYRISELKAGLVYLPFGIGSCLGAYCSGSFYFHSLITFPTPHQFFIISFGYFGLP
jgi:predicted MFS family arabinose efflux permease